MTKIRERVCRAIMRPCVFNDNAFDPATSRELESKTKSERNSVRLNVENNNYASKGSILTGEPENSREAKEILSTTKNRSDINEKARIDCKMWRLCNNSNSSTDSSASRGLEPKATSKRDSVDTKGSKIDSQRSDNSDFNLRDHSSRDATRRGFPADRRGKIRLDLRSSNTNQLVGNLEKENSSTNRMETSLQTEISETSLFDQPSQDFLELMKVERRSDWLKSLCELDPRQQILKFFNDVARDGTYRIEETGCTIKTEADSSPILRCFSKASAFSVWRPTSNDAIRKMMTGEATGKGLDVKGKSAKKGILSGFVPFLQIHEEKHKSIIRWPPRNGSIRIYYKSEAARNRAALELTSISDEMLVTVAEAKEIITKSCPNDPQRQVALENLAFEVTDPTIKLLDNYAPLHFGIVVAERVFFNAYISMQDISRSPDYETGRASNPDFQDMNSSCIRKYKGSGPRAVILQYSESVNNALDSESLIVAYEENGKVLPVVSDFDCFLVGTRHVYYTTPLPKDQVKLLKWLLTQIEEILDSPITPKSWTSRWLEVLTKSAKNGFVPNMSQFGFADAKTYAIMECAVDRLKDSGAVRHNAECSNYFFPQELDEQFLVISDRLEGNVPWKYVNAEELQDIMCKRIEEGYTFPLNPKWILADKGWKVVYDKLMASPDKSIQQSLDVWYPHGGIRERIEDIHRRFPDGFQKSNTEDDNQNVKAEGTEAMDLAQQKLRRLLLFRAASLKVKLTLSFRKSVLI